MPESYSREGELTRLFGLLSRAKMAAVLAAQEAQEKERQLSALKEVVECEVLPLEEVEREFDAVLYMERRAQKARSAADGAADSVAEASKLLKQCQDSLTDVDVAKRLHPDGGRPELIDQAHREFDNAIGFADARLEEAKKYSVLARGHQNMPCVKLKLDLD